MKRLIRHGVFETNSSSSHSISIARGANIYETLKVDIHGCVRIKPGEFGWDEERFYEPEDKASYAMAYAANQPSRDCFEMLEEVIKEHTGCKTVIFDKVKTEGERSPDYGYIDHQSDDVCMDAFASKETLKEFLFNPDSYVETDNDNH